REGTTVTTDGGLEAAWRAAVLVADEYPPRARDPARLEPHERRTLEDVQGRLRGGDRDREPYAGLSTHDCWAFAYLILRAAGEGKAEARARLGMSDGFLDRHFGWPPDPAAP
ncbi:MAG: hypothetical protein M3Q10_06185, partial [Chloroflexota bacterium]|nr:hypothetical protein [Chloroflexota bacterium]